MQKTRGIFFNARRRWFIAGSFALFIVALTAWTMAISKPALAAADRWMTYGTLVYNDKPFILQTREFAANRSSSYPLSTPFDDSNNLKEQDAGIVQAILNLDGPYKGFLTGTDKDVVIYTPVDPQTCFDKNNKERFHEYITFRLSDKIDSFNKGTYYKVDENDKNAQGVLNCTFPNTKTVTITQPANRRVWFYKKDTKVYSFNNQVSFTKTGEGPGGADLYFRDGDATAPVNGVACKDLLVNDKDKWIIFPMGPREQVTSYFYQGRNAVSEAYDTYTKNGGRAMANCLVNSPELRTDFGVGVLRPGSNVVGKKDEKCPDNLPGSVRWNNQDLFGTGCQPFGPDRNKNLLFTMAVSNNMAAYTEDDFRLYQNDNGYSVVRGVAAEAPPAVPNAGAGATIPPPSAGTATNTEDACKIGIDFGYLICSAAHLADAVLGTVQAIIASFLDVNPLDINGNGTTFKIWSALRDAANIAFIIAFLIIIFSQATSVGLTNYGIKRMLPRLIAVAILSNLSYYLCAAAIDIFNLLGAGVQGLAQAIMGNANVDISRLAALPAGTGNIEKLTLEGVGVGILTAMVKVKGAEAIVIPLLIGVLLVAIAILALLVRQIGLIAWVIISAWTAILFLLPGTEPTGKKVLKLGINLLFMYPLAMMVFAAGHVASGIIVATAPTGSTLERTVYTGFALGAKILPIAALPLLLTAGGVMTSWAVNRGRQWTQKAGQAMANSRGLTMRREARQAAKQKAYLDSLTGARSGPVAAMRRFGNRAGSLTMGRDARRELEERLYTARQKLESERSEGLQRRLTHGATLALASGSPIKTYPNGKGSFVDTNGNTVDLNAEDVRAVKYAQSIGATKSVAGARAIGTMLHDLAEMDEKRYNQVLGMGSNAVEKEQINNSLNLAAMKANQWHWAYNMVGSDGKVQVGRQKGPDVASAVQSIIGSKGIANMPKELYDDKYFDQPAVETALRNIYARNNDAFIRQTLNINEDKKLDGIATSLGITRAQLEAERQRVGQLYKG